MLEIDNHKELATEAPIPYLLQFPEFYKLVEQSGDRHQAIESIIWQLLRSLDYTTASGVWLDYIGKKVGQSKIYSPKPTDAFTFGGTKPEGFGAGRFKSAQSLKGTRVARSDASFRNAIRAKIIQNNTDTSLDELISACKLLFNAKLVRIIEKYPANIEEIHLYGSNVLQTLDALEVIKSSLAAGVSLEHLYYHNFYNLFENDAFTTYTGQIPATNDFELSFIIVPNQPVTKRVSIFSQDVSFGSELTPISCFYDPNFGIVFKTEPFRYHDNNNFTTYYQDGENRSYVDSEGDVYLVAGKDLERNVPINLKITRVGNTFSLYIDDKLQDQETAEHVITNGEGVRFYLGTANNEYFNSGSIYNLYLLDKTENQILINDPLKQNTIGINNGVRFL